MGSLIALGLPGVPVEVPLLATMVVLGAASVGLGHPEDDVLRRVAVAAFPEIHPRSPDRASDRRHLAAKLAAADFGMTQFFWEVEHYERMVAELADLGCTTPVLPGVMPFVNVAGARRMSASSCATVPASLQERIDVVDGDPEATRKLGVEVATDLVAGLLELGVPGVHLYALNRANAITESYDNLAIRPT